MAVIWEEEESDTWIMADETIIWEDKQSDMWMIEDDTIIWEDEDVSSLCFMLYIICVSVELYLGRRALL